MQQLGIGIYILNLVFISIFVFFIKTAREKIIFNDKIFFLIVTCTVLFLLLALRGNYVGTDTKNYLTAYQQTQIFGLDYLLESRFEIGFKILMFISMISNVSEQFFLAICAALTIIPICYLIYRCSDSPFLSIWIYITFGFYNMAFSGLRQAIAWSFCTLAYLAARERKIFKFIVWVLISMSFHLSAFIFFPAYFLIKIKKIPNFKNICLFISMFILLSVFKMQLISIVVKYIYPLYVIEFNDSGLWMFLGVLIVFCSMLFYHNSVKNNLYSKDYYIMVIFGVFLMYFAKLSNNVMRMSDYYYLYLILLLPAVVNSISNLLTKTIVYFVIILVSLYIYINNLLLSGGQLSICPYIFFWQ